MKYQKPLYWVHCTDWRSGGSGVTGHCTKEVSEVNMPGFLQYNNPQIELDIGPVKSAKQYNWDEDLSELRALISCSTTPLW